MQVFFYEAFEEEAEAIRHYLPEGIEAGFTAKTIAEAGHDVPPAPLISVRTQSFIPDAWEGTLEAVLSRSTGYDHLADLAGRFTTPPALGYLPLYCHTAVAEQTLMCMLALSRRLRRQLDHFQRFHRDGLTGFELTGRTVAVFGMGHIGLEVARLCRGIGMTVLGVELEPTDDSFRYVDPDDAMEAADVIVCAMDLRPSNRGYFDRDRIGSAKRAPLFVNISRGELSPSTVLLEALDRGLLSGVALDVYEHEKLLAEPLRAGAQPTDAEAGAALALSHRDDALCTPHNAFNTAEAVGRKAEHSVWQVMDWVEHRRFRWPAPVSIS